MAEKHLIEKTIEKFLSMPANERISKIRKLASISDEYDAFIRQTYPQLYSEAFPLSLEDVGSKPGQKTSQAVGIR